ncbi:hypothetical protein [Roseibium aggregatum]|uniref:Uncharacterized protein n=1 Tax=Roseibium aggregatum TaxID=187304 RepID=A0A939J0D9_9HYPH|nr:hypothetical protein [Roseibium aggregatum]MBN9669178.1 hypothetical protein [Roseibium aggregatum]
MNYHFCLSIVAPLAGVMMMSPIDAGSLDAARAERYVCSGENLAYTVMAEPRDPGPATLLGFPEARQETALFKRSKSENTLRYESEEVRFYGVRKDMVLEIGSTKLGCRLVRKPGPQTVAVLQTSPRLDGTSVRPAFQSVGVILRGGPAMFDRPGEVARKAPVD